MKTRDLKFQTTSHFFAPATKSFIAIVAQKRHGGMALWFDLLLYSF